MLGLRGRAHREAGHYDQAITDLTNALIHDPDYTWALILRGEAHREAGRYDQAITDLTNALNHHPEDAWLLALRGEAHRLAGRYDDARQDLTAAAAARPDDLEYRFELLLLETLARGFASQEERWVDLFASPLRASCDAEDEQVFALFEVLFLSPERDPAEAARDLLATDPDFHLVTGVRSLLAELAAGETELAERARQCDQYLAEHGPN
ncbi:tetratricopeptide repeat protein [Streptomyces sp. SID4926]|nr:tetratricopeptide repeat protein [Streptomyces sp. SID4926]